RMTSAQLDLRDWAPAPCHPALRFSGIIGQLFCVRTAEPTFDLELVGPADPAIDARRIPKNGIDRGSLGLIVGIDLAHFRLDLERIECPRFSGYLLLAY